MDLPVKRILGVATLASSFGLTTPAATSGFTIPNYGPEASPQSLRGPLGPREGFFFRGWAGAHYNFGTVEVGPTSFPADSTGASFAIAAGWGPLEGMALSLEGRGSVSTFYEDVGPGISAGKLTTWSLAAMGTLYVDTRRRLSLEAGVGPGFGFWSVSTDDTGEGPIVSSDDFRKLKGVIVPLGINYEVIPILGIGARFDVLRLCEADLCMTSGQLVGRVALTSF